MTQTLDIERALKGARQIYMEGVPIGHGRLEIIEEAIALIQQDPEGALKQEYLGMKNYAHFGDQREDHKYGYGPKHGHIVFSVGRNKRRDAHEGPLDGDAIYLLEAARDFGSREHPWEAPSSRWHDTKQLNLVDWLRLHVQLLERVAKTTSALDFQVETHVVQEGGA